jgi:hypothetical protein
MQEFFELKLGNMSVEEYENKFLELLRYVGFIKEEQVRIQRFLSGLPSFYRDEIQFNEPKTLEEAIRKAKYLYEQKKRRAVVLKSWRDEKNDNIDQRKKGFKPPSFKSSPIAYQQSQSAQSEPKMAESSGKKRPRSPIKCWGCKGEHMYRYCPHKGDKMRTMHDIQEATTVEDVGRVGRSIPMIYVALEDHDQSHMILQEKEKKRFEHFR